MRILSQIINVIRNTRRDRLKDNEFDLQFIRFMQDDNLHELNKLFLK